MLSPRTLPCIGLPISPFSGGILPLPLILVRGFSDVHTREAIPLPISNREVKLSRAPVVLSWETRREVGVTSDSFPFSGGFFFFFAVGVGAGWYQVMQVMRVGGGRAECTRPPFFVTRRRRAEEFLVALCWLVWPNAVLSLGGDCL